MCLEYEKDAITDSVVPPNYDTDFFLFKFKVCKSVHHRTIQINHQPDATIFHIIILTFIYSSTCFGRFHAHHQELNDCSGSRPARPRTQHDCHHDTKVTPEAANAVIVLLMMGGKTPETCWAVNKRQDNKLENCCIWLVIYLNCTIQMLSEYPSIGKSLHTRLFWMEMHKMCSARTAGVSAGVVLSLKLLIASFPSALPVCHVVEWGPKFCL
jgi:hypothetical protein